MIIAFVLVFPQFVTRIQRVRQLHRIRTHGSLSQALYITASLNQLQIDVKSPRLHNGTISWPSPRYPQRQLASCRSPAQPTATASSCRCPTPSRKTTCRQAHPPPHSHTDMRHRLHVRPLPSHRLSRHNTHPLSSQIGLQPAESLSRRCVWTLSEAGFFRSRL